MNKRPLDQLFFATFRGNLDFSEFASLNVSQAYSKIEFEGRAVFSPGKTLKHYLSFLSRVLFDRLPVEKDVVYSYRKGVNVVNAVEKHADNKFFFQSDIENFFGNITKEIIKKTILSAIDQCPIADIETWIERILDLVTIEGALPPGYPTSPAISNACLLSFDKRLFAWCNEHSLIYTRYADDIIVSGTDDTWMNSLSSKVTELLNEELNNSIKLNPQKTKIIRPGEKIKILGIAILPNGKVSVDGKLKKRTETAMHLLLKDKKMFQSFFKEADLDKALKKFSGQLNYINTVDPSFLDKLRKKYGTATVDKIIHISVAS